MCEQLVSILGRFCSHYAEVFFMSARKAVRYSVALDRVKSVSVMSSLTDTEGLIFIQQSSASLPPYRPFFKNLETTNLKQHGKVEESNKYVLLNENIFFLLKLNIYIRFIKHNFGR